MKVLHNARPEWLNCDCIVSIARMQNKMHGENWKYRRRSVRLNERGDIYPLARVVWANLRYSCVSRVSGLHRHTYTSDFAMNGHESWRLKPDENLARGIVGTGQGILRSRKLIEPCLVGRINGEKIDFDAIGFNPLHFS